jgi:hypothetical protein
MSLPPLDKIRPVLSTKPPTTRPAIDAEKLDFFKRLLRVNNITLENFHSLDCVSELINGAYKVSNHNRICKAHDPAANRFKTQQVKELFCSVDGLDELLTTNKKVEMVGTGRMKKSINLPEIQTTQSFDQIIMECQDMLSVETEVKKAYEKWLGKDNIRSNRWKNLLEPVGLFLTACGIYAMSSVFYFEFSVNQYIAGFVGMLSSSFVIFRKKLLRFAKSFKSEKSNKRQPTEQNKFQFLKESYVGTIQKLDDRLNIIKSKINTQIDAHTQDKEQVLQYQDMFDETDSVIHKIERAISSLRESHDKVSEKKAELHKTLNDYIGENGYISQKEQELERIKVAQELSDRMQTNFGKTLEIVKNVDVLTDAIIPGIKQLMEFRIPELIEKVEFECDKERVMFETKQ